MGANRLKKISLGAGLLTMVGAGHYQFIGGQTDQALGVVGSYAFGGPRVQPLSYVDPASFKIGIEKTLETQPDLRRLVFKCADGSKEFTVYINPIGILGIPDHGVQCADGFPLLVYKEDVLKKQDSFITNAPEWSITEDKKE